MESPYPYTGAPTVKFLTNVGGSFQVTTNNSAANVDYYYDPPDGYSFVIHSLCIQISDDANFNQADYGAISGGLINGLSFWLRRSGVEVPLLAGQIVKRNLDWARISPNFNLTQWAGLPQTLIPNHVLDYRWLSVR